MELRLLRYFVAVVDDGSVSRAAVTVAVAQPSLSRQLRGLEAELGVTLFDRSQRSLRLAPAGEAFLPMARDLVARADRALATMSLLGDARTVPLTLVAPETTVEQGHAIAHQVETALRASYPHLTDVVVHVEPVGDDPSR